jgi:hypothetical protein
VVLVVDDVHIALQVQGNPPGSVELACVVAEAAPGAQQLARLGELLYPVVAAVHDIESILLIDGDS